MVIELGITREAVYQLFPTPVGMNRYELLGMALNQLNWRG